MSRMIFYLIQMNKYLDKNIYNPLSIAKEQILICENKLKNDIWIKLSYLYLYNYNEIVIIFDYTLMTSTYDVNELDSSARFARILGFFISKNFSIKLPKLTTRIVTIRIFN